MDTDGQPVDNNEYANGFGNLGGDVPEAGNDENVDQYFDDGGETFLPADHVSQLTERSGS